jgi:hypothetical protein
MLRKICVHSGDYEECSLLGFDAVWLLCITDVSEERIASIIMEKRISQLGTTFAVTSSLILFTMMMEAIRSYETSVLTRATRRHISEDGILHISLLFHTRMFWANAQSREI